MATGKPILIVAHEKSEISLCVIEHNLGWVVEPNNPIKLGRLFEDIYMEYNKNKKFNKTDSRKIAEEYFSKRLILEKYNNLFQ